MDLSKLFHLPWPPQFFWSDCDCCITCTNDANCDDAAVTWEFTVAGVTNNDDCCCDASGISVNRTYTLTYSGGTIPSWGVAVSVDCEYTLNYNLGWNQLPNHADLNAYVSMRFAEESVDDRLVVFYGNMSVTDTAGDGLSLNHNAEADCNPAMPTPPEIITNPSGLEFGQHSRIFEVWYNQHSNCAPLESPTSNLVTITNTGTPSICVDGSEVVPTGTFTDSGEFAGYATGDVSDFEASSEISVRCCEALFVDFGCGSDGDWYVTISRGGQELAVYSKSVNLDCCAASVVFDLFSNTSQCGNWPATITLVPSGATC